MVLSTKYLVLSTKYLVLGTLYQVLIIAVFLGWGQAGKCPGKVTDVHRRPGRWRQRAGVRMRMGNLASLTDERKHEAEHEGNPCQPMPFPGQEWEGRSSVRPETAFHGKFQDESSRLN